MKTENIETAIGAILMDEPEHFPRIIRALEKALKEDSTQMIEDVSYDAGGDDEFREEYVTPVKEFEYKLTVRQFCEKVGIIHT